MPIATERGVVCSILYLEIGIERIPNRGLVLISEAGRCCNRITYISINDYVTIGHLLDSVWRSATIARNIRCFSLDFGLF
jgi:hypothetical protein